MKRYFGGAALIAIVALTGAAAPAAAPKKAAAAPAAAQAGISPDDPRWKRQVIQPDRRVVELTEYDAPADWDAIRQLVGRLDSISAKYGSEGKARYWYSAFCGNMTSRLNVTVEFPNVVSMAQAWTRIQSGPEIHKWDSDARAAGLSLRSHMMLDQIAGPPLANANYASADTPPRVLQFLEMDTGNDADGVIKGGEALKKLTDELKVDRQQRTYQMDFVGTRPRLNMLLIEYASFEAMQRGNILIDNSPVFAKMMTARDPNSKTPPAKRLSECVAVEIR